LLIGAGCFDCFGVERASLLASIDTALEYAALVRPDDANQAEMFLDEDLVPKPSYAEAPPMQFAARLRLEKETLGLYVSGYPTQEYESFIQELQIPTLSESVQSQSKSIRSIVFIVEVKVIRTKAMQNMAFLTICDKEEEWEAVVFPDTYAQFRSIVQEDSTLLLEAAMSVRNGRKQWVVSGIYPLERIEEYEAELNKRLYIKLPSQYDKGLFAKITKTLLHYPGLAQVFIYYEKEHKMVQLSRPFSVHPNEECIKVLKEISGADNVALKM
jgi:DNA polymerase-3 subunit alpha